ncbi:amidase signature enzyme [Cyathus striatus]|nr:amidase signature enzyme [Cyathus striatus]
MVYQLSQSATFFTRDPKRTTEVALPDLYEASVLELQDGLDKGLFTSVDLVKAYFARIEEVNLKGPALRAVLETNPNALATAALLDKNARRRGSEVLCMGFRFFLKYDNIATLPSEGMNTTAGSFSLLGSVVPDDAHLVKRLRQAGAIILGKANLSEFAHFRGQTTSGWSAIGGQCTNAYFPNANPCGSSGGSGVSASIGLAAVTLGTETDGSITCPASHNNVVGIKPTVGLTSRAGVVPISSHQDIIGPMTRSLTDAAIVLSIIAGKDANDNYTLAQPTPVPDYTKALNPHGLKGARIGVPRKVFLNDSVTGNDPAVNVAFEQALDVMRELGATIVDPADIESAEELIVSNKHTLVLMVDFKIEIAKYLKSLVHNPSGAQSLADLIKFNNEHAELEMPENYTDQSTFTNAEATKGQDDAYFQALAYNHECGSTRGIDATLKEFELDALVLPALGHTTHLAAIVGYPIITVPLGFYPENTTIGTSEPVTVYPAPGVPFGLSFLGTAFSEFDLIGYAYAYEQKTKTRLARRAYSDAIPKTQLVDVIGI